MKQLKEGWPELPHATDSATPANGSGAAKTVAPVDQESEQSELAQKITIVNKIPPTVVAVLKQQFRLMNKWMQPIHEATQDSARKCLNYAIRWKTASTSTAN